MQLLKITDDIRKQILGIANSIRYELDDVEYFYAETTAVGWQIGEIPDMDSSTAILYPVS